MSNLTTIIAGFADEHGILLREDAPEKLAQFTMLLLKANEAMNLIGPMPAERVAVELVGDSLMVLGLLGALGISLTGPVADVGSGAGLPGIPLAIARPELEFHLIEPRDRRYRFLGMAIRRLKLENVTRHRARIEESELPPMGAAISRAFAPVPRWLEVGHDLVQPGGQVIVCASQTDVAELDALIRGDGGAARFDIAGQRAYGLEGTVDRAVVLLQRKTS